MLNIFSYFILPAYTILLALEDSLFEANLSVISSTLEHKDAFMFWAFMIVAFIYLVLHKVIEGYHLEHARLASILVTTTCVLLILAATTPYLPEEDSMRANLHVLFAFTSSITLLASFLSIIVELRRRDKKEYNKYFVTIIVIGVLSSILVILFGMVTGFLEIFVTLSGIFMAKALYERSQKYSRT